MTSSSVLTKRPTQAKEDNNMHDQPQNPIRRAAMFVRRHPFLTGAVVGGVVGHKLGYDAAVKNVIDEAAQLSYRWGTENGVLAVQNSVMLDFINKKGLSDEMREFLYEIGNHADEPVARAAERLLQ